MMMMCMQPVVFRVTPKKANGAKSIRATCFFWGFSFFERGRGASCMERFVALLLAIWEEGGVEMLVKLV